MTAAGSVAGPSRLANQVQPTFPRQGGGEHGYAPIFFGVVTRDSPPPLGALPNDTGGEADVLYRVDKGYRFANIAGVQLGQIPVPYDRALSRTLSTSGASRPSAPFTASTKGKPNQSWREEFHQWAQRFPNASAPPGEGMWKVNNPYYPDNIPSQLSAQSQAPSGMGNTQRGQSDVISPFVVRGGRGMKSYYQNLQTRLAPNISYSSTTKVLGGSVFNAASLSGG